MELYFESGYLEASYFGNLAIASSSVSVSAGVSAQGDIASVTGYYIPDYIVTDYFQSGLIVGNAVLMASFASVSAVNKTVNANAVFTATFIQTGTISHIEGADLFAFTNAAIAVQVSRLRDNNIAVSAVFSIAVDGIRIRLSAGDDSALFSFTANTVLARSRDYASSQSAAFSLAVDAVKTARASSSQQSQFTQTALASKAVVASANLLTHASIFVSRNVGNIQNGNRPRNLSSGAGFSTQAKFGSHSLSGGNNFNSNFVNNNFIVPTAAQSFYLEMWHYPTTSDANHEFFAMFEFFAISQTSTGKYKFQGYGGNPNSNNNVSLAYGYTHTVNHTLNQWNHLAVVHTSTHLAYYINGQRVYVATEGVNPIPYYGWGSLGNQSGALYGVGTHRTSNIICRGGPYLLDEVYFVHDTTLGQSPTSLTIDVPTQARSTTTETKFLYHFDNNANDDVSIQHQGAAGLTSVSSVSATVGFITNAQASISASSSVAAVIGTLETTNLVAFSDAAVITNGNRIRTSTADCSTSLSVSTTAFRIKQIASVISATASIDIQAIKTAVGASNNSIAFTQSSQAVKTVSTGSNVSSQTTFTGTISHIEGADLFAFTNSALTAAGLVNRSAVSNQTSAVIQTATALRIKQLTSGLSASHNLAGVVNSQTNGSANFALSVSIAVQGTKFKGTAVGVSSTFITTNFYYQDDYIQSGYYEQFETTAVKTARGTAAIQSVSTLTVGITASVFAALVAQSSSNVTATVKKTVSVQIANASLFAQTATATRIRPASAIFTVNTTITAQGIKGGEIALQAFTNASISLFSTVNRPSSAGLNTTVIFFVNTQDSLNIGGDSDLNVVSTFTASARKIAIAQAQIQAAGFVISVSVAQKTFLAQFATVSTLTASTVKVARGTATITSTGSVSATIGVRKPFTAAITSALTFVVAVRELRLDAIVYVIPAEGWSYRIEGETRLHTIISESRVKEIVGETRLHTINGESRIHII